MKGYIQDQAIALLEPLPDDFQNGDEVEIIIVTIAKKKKIYPFPVFDLKVKDDHLDRAKIYALDPSSI